uniref:Fungal specific transcription factor domain-containing protein n=1 Tax=Colletotrichum fructicola (strain Nara gc5) TaxID=1213859 RepID=L2GHK8_COLFN
MFPGQVVMPDEDSELDTVMMSRAGFTSSEMWEYIYPTAQSMAADPNNTLFPPSAIQPPASQPPMVTTAIASSLSDNQPPWLWSDPFTSINNRFDDVPMDTMDVNMDNLDDFNWQNWQESIKGFEMDPENMPAKGAW